MSANENKRRVAIVGATGNQGGAVIKYLLNRETDIQIRALTRNVESNRAKALQERGCEIAAANLSDRQSLEAAFADCWGVYLVTLTTPNEEQDARRLINAAISANVRYVVLSSVGSANTNTGVPHFDTKGRNEQYLLEKKDQFEDGYAILRPVFFMENWLLFPPSNGVVMGMTKPNTKVQMIAAKDIGAYGGMALLNPQEFSGKELDIAGDFVSGIEVAEALSQVANCRMVYQEIPWYYWLAMRLFAQEDFVTMVAWFESAGYSADIGECRQMNPELQTFADFAQEKFEGKDIGPKESSMCDIL